MTSPATTSWEHHAACTARLDLPWTRDLADVSPWDAIAMCSVCDGCPVALDCLNAVDRLDVTGGWWAGHDRDPHAFTADIPPAWATSTPDVPAAGTTWQPVTTRRGRVGGEKALLTLALVTGSAA